MKVLIVEDEIPIATYIQNTITAILKNRQVTVAFGHTLEDANRLTDSRAIDLCLLDLNLNGEDGFEILKKATAHAFETIVISANVVRAVEAFEYGVLDFIPKPFETHRLKTALDRFLSANFTRRTRIQYISFRRKDGYHVLRTDSIKFFKASNIYVEAHLWAGSYQLLDKTMEIMEKLLPADFFRIHRSYIVRLSDISHYKHAGGGIYQVTLKDNLILPLSRDKYKYLLTILNR